MYDHYVQKFRLKRAKTDRKAKRSPKWLRIFLSLVNFIFTFLACDLDEETPI